ncbi:TPA: hypothetical protein ACGIK9_003342 [Acinetobacter baumannii]|uniref:hypothetical protein n=1 Tax=Acinetobacter baumannii TaxID=470 RepID=UPI00338DC15F
MKISAYTLVKEAPFYLDDNADYRDHDNVIRKDAFTCNNEPGFQEYAQGLTEGKIYTFEECDEQYLGTSKDYNNWRNMLAQALGYEKHELDLETWRTNLAKEMGYDRWQDARSTIHWLILSTTDLNEINRTPYLSGAWQAINGPHWLLLNYTDNTGVIGNEYCKKIYQELLEFEPKAKSLGNFFLEKYIKMRDIFGLAQNGGVVQFG